MTTGPQELREVVDSVLTYADHTTACVEQDIHACICGLSGKLGTLKTILDALASPPVPTEAPATISPLEEIDQAALAIYKDPLDHEKAEQQAGMIMAIVKRLRSAPAAPPRESGAGVREVLESLLAVLPGENELLTNASLNDGRASEFDMASVRLRKQLSRFRRYHLLSLDELSKLPAPAPESPKAAQ